MIKKIMKILGTIIKVIAILFVLLFLFVVIIQRIFNNEVSIGGYRLFTIVTGSMEPEYKVYDMIIAKEVDPETLEVGDDVVYIGREGAHKDKVITHRIIKVDEHEEKLEFLTQGIANTGVDPLVYEDQIIGQVVRKSFILSFMTKLVSSPFGFILLILIPGSILIASEIADKVNKEE